MRLPPPYPNILQVAEPGSTAIYFGIKYETCLV